MKNLATKYIFMLATLCIANLAQAKRPDPPRDSSFVAKKASTGRMVCLVKALDNSAIYGEGKDCTISTITTYRHDLYSRLSTRDNQTGLEWCLTSTSNLEQRPTVADVAFRLCTINNIDQQWIVRTSFVSNMKLEYLTLESHSEYILSVKKNSDSGDKVYLAKQGFADPLFFPDTTIWYNTWRVPVAAPSRYVLEFKPSWSYQAQVYQLFPPSFSSNLPLLYEEDRGVILDQSGRCLRSTIASSSIESKWKWLEFTNCPPRDTSPTDDLRWLITTNQHPITGNSIRIRDIWGNSIVVGKWGGSWGTPFLASYRYLLDNEKSGYLAESFAMPLIDFDGFQQLNRSAMGEANQCRTQHDIKKIWLRTPNSNEPQILPLGSEEWSRWLYNVSRSTSQQTQGSVGFCGVCMLHTVEMLHGMLTAAYGVGSPIHVPVPPRGHFFFTGSLDPISSFRSRHRRRAENLIRVRHEIESAIQDWRWLPRQWYVSSMIRAGLLSSDLMLPSYRSSSFSANAPDGGVSPGYQSLYRRMQQAPAGTIFLLGYTMITDLGINGHSIPLYRSSEGIHMLPTNQTTRTFEQWREIFNRAYINTSVDQEIFWRNLYNGTITNTVGLGTSGVLLIQYGRPPDNDGPFTSAVSFGDCDGDGPNARGPGMEGAGATSNLCSVNQVSRCTIL